MADGGLFIGLLGPLDVRRGSREVRIGSGKQRLVLGFLAVAGRAVSTDELVDVLWGDTAPPTATGTLQTHISRLRALIGPAAVVSDGSGYRLDLGGGEIDAETFTAAVAAASEERTRGDHASARRQLRKALSAWRGPALATFRYEPFAQLTIARLEALRLEAVEDRCELDVDAGDTWIVAELEALAAENPFRERLTMLLMRALYRSGRQADALDAARRLRRALREDLGLDPSPEVDALERRILDQDPALAAAGDPLPRRHWHAVIERAELPTPEPGRRCDQLVEQARSLRRAGRISDARSTAAAAVRLAGALDDDRRLAVAALALAGPPEDAVAGEPLDRDLLERALGGLGPSDPLTPMLQARLAVGYVDGGDAERGHALLASAEALASAVSDTGTGTGTGTELYVLRARHRTWFDPRGLDGRLALADRIAELAERTGRIEDRAWAARWLAVDLLEAGDVAGFDRNLHELAQVNEQIQDPFHGWAVVARRAGRRTATGPMHEAEALATDALAMAAGLGSDYAVAATSGLLFVLRWRQDRLHELDELVQELADREPSARALVPLLHLELGRPDDARRALRAIPADGVRRLLAADAVGITHPLALTALSHAAHHTGELDVAAQVLRELEPIRAVMAVFHPGMAVLAPVAELRAAVLACLGRLDEAITEAEAAARICEQTGFAAVGVRTNALLARLLRRRGGDGDRARARRLDDEIHRQATVTGAAPPAWHAPAPT